MWLVNLTVTKQFVHFLVEGDWGMLCMASFGHFDATCTDCVNWQWLRFIQNTSNKTETHKDARIAYMANTPAIYLGRRLSDCTCYKLLQCMLKFATGQHNLGVCYTFVTGITSGCQRTRPSLGAFGCRGWTDTSLKVYPSLWHLMTFSWVCHIWAQDVRSWRRFWR